MIDLLINIVGYACILGLCCILLLFIYIALHRGQKPPK